MTTGLTKPEWDTPPNGDFASYVERLTAARPVIPVPVPSRPGAKAPATFSVPAVSVGDAHLPLQVLARAFGLVPGELQLQPFLRVLRTARVVLLVLAALHVAALLLWGRGSLVGLLMMAGLWWGLGWLMQSAAQLGGAQASGVNTATQALQDRLRQVAQQRSGTGSGTGKKKP